MQSVLSIHIIHIFHNCYSYYNIIFHGEVICLHKNVWSFVNTIQKNKTQVKATQYYTTYYLTAGYSVNIKVVSQYFELHEDTSSKSLTFSLTNNNQKLSNMGSF